MQSKTLVRRRGQRLRRRNKPVQMACSQYACSERNKLIQHATGNAVDLPRACTRGLADGIVARSPKITAKGELATEEPSHMSEEPSAFPCWRFRQPAGKHTRRSADPELVKLVDLQYVDTDLLFA